MNTFNYNTSSINHYVTTDLGSLGDTPTSVVDNGETAYDLVVSGDYIVTGDILVNFFTEEDYQEINFTETTYPFGTFKVSNTTDSAATVVFVSKPEPIKLYQKAIVVRKQAWTGSGTLFEIADGRERMVAPWIGSSGPLRVSGGAESSVTHKFTEDSIKTYGSSVDYGLVPAAVGSSIAYGPISDIVDEGEFDNGDIVSGDGRPYGLFSLEGFNSSNFRIKAWAGSGNIHISGQESSQLDEPTPQIYIVRTSKLTGVGLNIYNSINPDSFTRATYQGSGSLFEIGQKDERAVFVYNIKDKGSYIPDLVLDTTSSYDNTNSNVAIRSSGSGIGSSGGFNSTGSHWIYTGQNINVDRILRLNPLDGRLYSDITLSVIAGTSLNGGETPDANANEDLLISYSIDGGLNFTLFETIDTEDAEVTGSTFGQKTIAIPEAAKVADVVFKIYQSNHTGQTFDNWGVDLITLTGASTFASGQEYESIDNVNNGTVDQSAGTTESYGNISSPTTNGILDYGQLNPGLFKFGDINISGGDRAHANPKAYRGGIQVEDIPSTVNTTILPDEFIPDYNGSINYSRWSIEDSGTGLSSQGGFNIGRHLRSTAGQPRELEFDFDTRLYNEIAITCIRGNNSNGGDQPESNDVLKLSYWKNNLFWSEISIVLAHDSVDGVTEVVRNVITIPEEAKSETTRFKIHQTQSFNNLDNYGITQVEILGAVGAPAGSFDLQPTLLNVNGNATVQFVEPAAQIYVVNGSGVLTLSGTMPEQYIIGNYNTTGSFIASGQNDERAVFDYNDSSIEVVQDPIDNGSLSSFGSTSDYGQVTQPSVGETNYGQVAVPYTIQPFGRLFEVTGGDRAHANPKAYLGATAEIRITGGYSNLQFTSQAGESTVLFNTSGGDADSFGRIFIGSGSLFHIGDRVEKAVYAYNSSSTITYEEPVDDGLITNSATQFTDYGSVGSDYYPNINYGSVLVDGSDVNPLGKLFEIGGTASEDFFPTFAWNRQSPPIRIFNEQQDPADFRFRPHWRTDTTTTNPPKLRNAPDGEFNTYAQVRPFIASGSLFHIGDKLESATYDYNESSVVEFTPGGDYGSITSASSANIDYGAVTGIVTEGEFDNGQLVITETTQPYVGLFSFQGVASTFFIRGPYSSKEGVIRIFNEQQDPADFTFRPHWRSRPYEQGKLTGNAETPRTRPFIGSGSLFHIGDKIEKAVFTYNNSSITIFETAEDYQSITSNATSNIDYGAVDGIVTEGEFDNGQLVITETTQPYGLFNITGNSVDKWHQCFTKIGSGSLFSFNGGIERRTDDYPESTVLFNFTGNLTESFSKGLYTGSGSLFHIGDRIEKAVFSYNNSSIIASASPNEEFGFVTDPSTTSSDYGSVVNAYLPPNTDNGDLITLPGDENPFGLFKIAGGDIGHKQTFREFSSGSLFGIGNAAEAAVWQTPEETFLLKMRGGAVEKHVENWVGSGTIKYPEDTPLAPNAAVRFRPHWRGRSFESPITLNGVCGEFFRGSYVGNKSNVSFKILTPNEGFEWRQYRPSPRYVNSVYGKIGGSATVAGISVSQKVNVYGYYGDDRDPGTSGSLFTFNSATEVAGYNPVTDTVLYTASGTAASKWNPAWTSRPDGSPRLSGTPELQLRFNIFTNPEVEVFKFDGTPDLKITLNYNGSGTLFTTNGSSEVLGFNPSTDTVLFRASGNPIVLFSLLHIGSGSLFGFGSAAEARTILAPESTVLFIPSGSGTENFVRAHEGSGTNIVSGTVEETFTNAYQGEGSLFSAGSAAEVTAISEAESTVLFKASGGEANAFVRSATAEGNVTISDNLDEAFARPYVGEGSLFGFNGAAEAVTVDEESTGLFNFIGDANIVRDRSFVGSGSLFGIGGASEASVISPDLETGLFEITGSAVGIRTRSFTPDGGETFVYGDGGVVSTRIYTGKGSLFGIGGATESTTTNLPQNTLLYTVEGRGVVTRARDFAGSESIFISGNALPVAAVVFTGSGTLSTFNGAAESRTITSESTVLFKPSGGATESFTEGNYDASGSTTISGEASDIKNTRSETVFAYVSTNGEAIARQTYAYLGTGTFSTFNGAAEARAIDIETPVSVNLFTVVGNNPGSVTRVTQPETAKFVLSGASVNVLKLFSPIRIFSTII
jgi:hypothetical protein